MCLSARRRNCGIDGKPVLDLTRARDRQKLSEVLAMADSTSRPDLAAKAPMEYGDTIRQRNRDKRIITDDNMGTEWN